MNTIAVIILIALVAEYVLNIVADHLDLRVMQDELPDTFQGLYDGERYRKSQQYLRTNTRFGWVSGTFFLLVILIFWFGRGFPFLDGYARSLGQGPVVTGVLYIGAILLFQALLFSPFSIYATFVIEERFGFNKTTWATFLKDRAKYLLLSILLGGPLLAGILLFLEYTGENAWWLCWVSAILVSLVAQYVVPTWIMPLFNRFEPLEEGELRDAIMACARSMAFPLENVFTMDSSKRSRKSNAFFTGFGRHKRIVLFDTLVEKHTVQELVAVLAHEMGHYKKRHILQTLIIGIIEMGVMFYLLSLFLTYQGLFDAFFMEARSAYAGLIFFGMLYSPIAFFLGVLLQVLSRKKEYEADRFAVATTGDPDSLVDALKKLSVDNLTNLTPHPLTVFLHYSHPPILERINAISERNFS